MCGINKNNQPLKKPNSKPQFYIIPRYDKHAESVVDQSNRDTAFLVVEDVFHVIGGARSTPPKVERIRSDTKYIKSFGVNTDEKSRNQVSEKNNYASKLKPTIETK